MGGGVGAGSGYTQWSGGRSTVAVPLPINLTELGQVGTLNSNAQYDSSELINNFFNNNHDDDFSLFENQICSPYTDINSLINTYSNTNTPLVLSLNIRSLSSNHSNLLTLLHQLKSNDIVIVAIVLQEIWNVKYPELVSIPGFHKSYLKMRTFSNGGGVGIFVNDDVSSKIIDIDNSFHEKIFECITIELSYSNRKTYISSIYRSPSPIKNISVSDQNNLFMSKLDAHLSFLNKFGSTSYVFLDANIDLSKINNHQPANEYADIILSNGFIQSITKSTRIHGQSFSLIDHILTNDISEIPKTGVLINDISDHFITFIELQKIKKNKINSKLSGELLQKKILRISEIV